eukprot:gene6789-16582_t
MHYKLDGNDGNAEALFADSYRNARPLNGTYTKRLHGSGGGALRMHPSKWLRMKSPSLKFP